MKKYIYLFVLVILIPYFSDGFTADTDVYVIDSTSQNVPPDILIVLDGSGSMRYPVTGNTLYIDPGVVGNYHYCGDNVAYYTTNSAPHTKSCTPINISDEYPDYNAIPTWGNESCTGPFYKYNSTGDLNSQTNCSRIAIAKRGIKKILDANNDGSVTADDETNETNGLHMKMGYMRFKNCSSYSSDSGDNYSAGCNQLIKPLGTSYDAIWSSVDGENVFSGTHVAYSLKEAKLYFDRTKNGYNANPHQDSDYTDPGEIPPDPAKVCRKKFVILITDGEDTLVCNGNGSTTTPRMRREVVAMSRSLANAGYKVFVLGFGAGFPAALKNTLNWAAYYGDTATAAADATPPSSYYIAFGKLYPGTLKSCSSDTTPDPGAQNISGYAYLAEDPQQLDQALFSIKEYILSLLAESTSYVAPVVPISQMQNTSSGNRMYLAMFEPTLRSLWNGNIKKFGIADAVTGNIRVGDIIDKNGAPAISTQNEIVGEAFSYWNETATGDGGEVLKGGTGALLWNRNLINNPRKIYTYVGSADPNAKSFLFAANAFKVDNAEITCAKLGITPDDATKRENTIKFIHGFNSYNWGTTKTPAPPDGKRDWILGAFIHSRPLVLSYPDGSTIIYAGANDGMLHAFDDNTGEELWAFIPPGLLEHLKGFETTNLLQIFVDGTPRAYIEKDGSGAVTKRIVIFGLRRGGDRYIALDLLDKDNPKFLWEISSPTTEAPLLGHEIKTGFERLGQTWSTPIIKAVAHEEKAKAVAFFAGGYDPCNDTDICGSSPQKGNAIYAVDVTNGSLIWSFTDPAMTYSIASDIAAVDTNGDGKTDRLYVGDLGGQLWRFDIGNTNNLTSWTGRVVFKSNQTSAEKRMIFAPPDVMIDERNITWVFFGTGDREKPKQETGTTTFPTRNRLYAIKDNEPATIFIESTDLVDLTDDILQKPNPTAGDLLAQEQTRTNLRNQHGWFITLEAKGEKSLSSPVVYSGVVYFTSYIPFYKAVGDPCTLGGEGSGMVYALQYMNGMAVFDFDHPEIVGPLDRADRSLEIGKGIPSKVVFAISGNQVSGYMGVGGGVASPPPIDKRNLLPLYWRTVF